MDRWLKGGGAAAGAANGKVLLSETAQRNKKVDEESSRVKEEIEVLLNRPTAPAGPGRPSKKKKEAESIYDRAAATITQDADALRSSTGDVVLTTSAIEYLRLAASALDVDLGAHIRSEAKVLVPVGPDATDAEAEPAEVRRPETNVKPGFKKLLQIHTQRWNADGTHNSWRSVEEVQAVLLEELNVTVSRSSAHRLIQAEQDVYEKSTTKTRPALPEVLTEIENVLKSLTKEPVHSTPDNGNYKFPPSLYPKLKEECDALMDTPGFGPVAVSSLAAALVNDLSDEDATPWQPSRSWAYWFMHEHLDLTIRAVTTDRVDPAKEAKQRELHDITLERLAYFKTALQVPDFAICAADETGVFLFPQRNFKWAKRGAKQVQATKGDDKRQITVCMWIDFTGKVVFTQMITTGKHARAMPSPKVREKFADYFLFQVSANHWSNHDLKLKAIIHMNKRINEAYVKSGVAPDEANLRPRVLLLDCWPVNLTDLMKTEVKAHCPGMTLLFIPAGGTGVYQIHDTDMHKPFKDVIATYAETWYGLKIREYRDRAMKPPTDPVYVTMEQYQHKVKQLTSIGTLRDRMVGWIAKAVAHLEAPRDDAPGGASIIKAAADRLYLHPIKAPGFIQAVLARATQRENDADANKLAVETQKAVLKDVAAAEAGGHLAAVPPVPKRKSKKTKGGALPITRPGGKRTVRSMEADALAAAEAESDSDADVRPAPKKAKAAPRKPRATRGGGTGPAAAGAGGAGGDDDGDSEDDGIFSDEEEDDEDGEDGEDGEDDEDDGDGEDDGEDVSSDEGGMTPAAAPPRRPTIIDVPKLPEEWAFSEGFKEAKYAAGRSAHHGKARLAKALVILDTLILKAEANGYADMEAKHRAIKAEIEAAGEKWSDLSYK
jgi:hypothetical protein